MFGKLKRRPRETSGTLAPLTELVNGPHHGYFVGSYVVPVIDGFVAYAKVYRQKPRTPWEGLAIAKFSANGSCLRTAIRLAEFRAICAIGRWGR